MKRHRLDPFSLVMGVLFAVVGLAYLIGGAGVSSIPAVTWPLPLGVIAIGAAIIGSIARGSRSGDDRDL